MKTLRYGNTNTYFLRGEKAGLLIDTYEGEIVFNEGRDGVKYCIEVVSEGKWTIDFGLGDPLTSE